MDELREPRLDYALRNSREPEGWAWFDQQPKEDPNEVEERERIEDRKEKTLAAAAILYTQSVEFRLVLEWMLDNTLRRAAWHPQLGVSTDQVYGFGCYREGQNSMVNALLHFIAEGLKLNPPQRRETV